MRLSRRKKFPELSYASAEDPLLRRVVIRTIEEMSGRRRFLPLYDFWRSEYVGKSEKPMGDMLEILGVSLDLGSQPWPPKGPVADRLVMIANHPFGIGDGIAILSLAEQLNRPFKVMIHKELLKVPEIRPYSLPVDFSETKEAMRANMQTRKEAVAAIDRGETIVIFPGGGVATARKPFGKASELPWKTFTARLIQSSKASVIPIYFHGQAGPLFHILSKFSMTLRTSLLLSEFRRFAGSKLPVTIGDAVPYEHFAGYSDRLEITDELYRLVHALAGTAPKDDIQPNYYVFPEPKSRKISIPGINR